MKPNPEFVKLPKSFWAAVKSVSQQCGYTVRGEGQVKVPTSDEIVAAFDALGLDRKALEVAVNGNPLLHVHIPLNPAADSERIRPPLGAPRRRASVVCLRWPTFVRFG